MTASEDRVFPVGRRSSLLHRKVLLISKQFLEVLLVAVDALQRQVGNQPLATREIDLAVKRHVFIRALEPGPIHDFQKGAVLCSHEIPEVAFRDGPHPRARRVPRDLKPGFGPPIPLEGDAVLSSGHEGRVALVVDEHGVRPGRVSVRVAKGSFAGLLGAYRAHREPVILLKLGRGDRQDIHGPPGGHPILSVELQSVLLLGRLGDEVL